MHDQRRLTRPIWNRVKGEHERGTPVEGVVLRQLAGGYLIRIGRSRQRMVMGFLERDEARQRGLAARQAIAPLREGDLISAYVEDYDDAHMWLKLSLRQLSHDTLVRFVESVLLGEKVVGRVVNLASAGAFVRLENGFDALLPTAEIPRAEQQPLEDVLHVGDLVAAIVYEKDVPRRHIHLSIERLLRGWKPVPSGVPTGGGAPIRAAVPASQYFYDTIPRAASRRLVAVLEDDDDILAGLASFLRDCGHEVHEWRRVRDFINDLGQSAVECAVVDLLVDGQQVLPTVVAALQSAQRDVRLVTCSAVYDRDVLAALLQARGLAIDALLKPVNLTRLAERVESCVAAERFEAEDCFAPARSTVAMPGVAAARQTFKKSRDDILDELLGVLCRTWPRDAVLVLDRTDLSPDPGFIRAEGVDRAAFERVRLQLQFSPVADVLEDGAAISLSGLADTPATRGQYLRRLVRCSSVIGAPVSIMDRPMYGLFILRSGSEPFSPADLQILERIAVEQRLPIERIRNIEAITRDHMRLSQANLLAGIAHETHNSLAAMMLTLQSLREQLPILDKGVLDAAGQQLLAGLIRSTCTRGEEITRLLRSFLTGVSQNQDATDELYRLLHDITSWVAPQAELAEISLDCDVAEELVDIQVPQFPIRQSIFNLLLNAIQQIRLGPCAERCVQLRGGLNKSGHRPVWLAVIDTGPGMHQDQVERIFEAYYTTRKEGSGLGLYLTRWCIESLGGRVYVLRTVRFGGTEFRIELPDPRTRNAA